MPQRKRLLILAAVLCGAAMCAGAQDDSPSLGDVARQTRQQRQQKDSQLKATDSSNAKDSQANKDLQTNTNKDAQIQSPSPNAAAKATPPAVKKVITNDEIPSHVGPYQPVSQPRTSRAAASPSDGGEEGSAKPSAQAVSNQIRAKKDNIATLQSEINRVSASIQYAGGNCVSGCVQWNEQQKRKQDEVDAMKSQLEQSQQQLEQMQESARKQGYSSTVYDP